MPANPISNPVSQNSQTKHESAALLRYSNNSKSQGFSKILSAVIPSNKRKDGPHESSKERYERVIKVAKELYDDMRWYHGTSLLNKKNIEALPSKNEKGGFEAPIQDELLKNIKSRFIYVSKDFKLASMYAFQVNRYRSEPKNPGGIVRIFGSADDLKLKWYEHGFTGYYREVKRTDKKPAFKSILTQDESPAIKALFHKYMKKKIADITQEESDLSLRKVRSFDGDDYERWLTLEN